MKYFLIAISAMALMIGCNNGNEQMGRKRSPEEVQKRVDSFKAELLAADVAFSRLSDEKGRNAAFLEYADDNATFLRPFSMPVTGRDTIKALLQSHSDTDRVLTGIPISADVARSGDIGYTYGTYSLDVKGAGREEGTYCTVWKRNEDHQWKFVLDTGNPGLKAEDKAVDKKVEAEAKANKKK